jgi:hypothetical protein
LFSLLIYLIAFQAVRTQADTELSLEQLRIANTFDRIAKDLNLDMVVADIADLENGESALSGFTLSSTRTCVCFSPHTCGSLGRGGDRDPQPYLYLSTYRSQLPSAARVALPHVQSRRVRFSSAPVHVAVPVFLSSINRAQHKRRVRGVQGHLPPRSRLAAGGRHKRVLLVRFSATINTPHTTLARARTRTTVSTVFC